MGLFSSDLSRGNFRDNLQTLLHMQIICRAYAKFNVFQAWVKKAREVLQARRVRFIHNVDVECDFLVMTITLTHSLLDWKCIKALLCKSLSPKQEEDQLKEWNDMIWYDDMIWLIWYSDVWEVRLEKHLSVSRENSKGCNVIRDIYFTLLTDFIYAKTQPVISMSISCKY